MGKKFPEEEILVQRLMGRENGGETEAAAARALKVGYRLGGGAAQGMLRSYRVKMPKVLHLRLWNPASILKEL